MLTDVYTLPSCSRFSDSVVGFTGQKTQPTTLTISRLQVRRPNHCTTEQPKWLGSVVSSLYCRAEFDVLRCRMCRTSSSTQPQVLVSCNFCSKPIAYDGIGTVGQFAGRPSNVYSPPPPLAKLKVFLHGSRKSWKFFLIFLDPESARKWFWSWQILEIELKVLEAPRVLCEVHLSKVNFISIYSVSVTSVIDIFLLLHNAYTYVSKYFL